MTKVDQYAVFGHPIGHSKSPRIHGLFARQTGEAIAYQAEDVPAEEFVSRANRFFGEGGRGLNCTIPLKELAWEYADSLGERARLAKAVNTLARQTDGSILGENTDGIGLLNDLTINNGIAVSRKNILILGAGGATRGIIPPLLEQQPTKLVIVNRTVERAKSIVDDFAGLGTLEAADYSSLRGEAFDLVINATSASLSGQLPPLSPSLLADGGSCYDLAYANQATAFVEWGIANRAVHSLDGLGMLVEQAAEAFYIWRGIRPDTASVIQTLDAERQARFGET